MCQWTHNWNNELSPNLKHGAATGCIFSPSGYYSWTRYLKSLPIVFIYWVLIVTHLQYWIFWTNWTCCSRNFVSLWILMFVPPRCWLLVVHLPPLSLCWYLPNPTTPSRTVWCPTSLLCLCVCTVWYHITVMSLFIHASYTALVTIFILVCVINRGLFCH